MPPATEPRDRVKAAVRNRERASALAQALYTNPNRCQAALARMRDTLQRELDPKTLRNIHRRYLRLSQADRDNFNQLRQDGAHASILLQFIGATQDHELDDRPIRDRIYREFQHRLTQQKGARPVETAARVLAPTLFVATCALVVPWLATKAAVATGTALALAGPVHSALEPIAKPLVDLIAAESGGWLSRAGLALAAWVGWGYAARVIPDLKQTMAAPETQVLDSALGPGNRPWQLHAALRAIPDPDRHLLAHLLPAELRAFLRGTDEQRRELLTANPPPLLAQVRSLMATHPPGLANFWRLSRDLGDLCLPECWRVGPFLNPRLDIDTRLENWRKQPTAGQSEALDVDEVIAAIAQPRARRPGMAG